ncbi:MAG TPA: helix-turn-helix domain-containing protein [Duganella sp.]|jgi:excisionase family DNA binding protein
MRAVTKRRRNSPGDAGDVLAGIAEDLVQKVPDLASETTQTITRALHDLLDGRDELSRTRRIGIQHYLIEVAEVHGRTPSHSDAETMLTTEAAAELMHCSRPYVAMLIDNKKLTGASVTEGGHRRVPVSSVRAWIKEREAKAKQSDYRAAAAETGMYAIPETGFVEAKTRRRP